MARTKTATSIDAEIQKVQNELDKVQTKYDKLADKLLKLKKQKQELEVRAIIDAFHESGKSLDELMTFLGK